MEDKYKVVIVDDDPVSLNALQFQLGSYSDLVLEGVAKNGVSGIHLIEKVHPNLLFLDVELPDMKGMDVLARLSSFFRNGMHVVFYTAHRINLTLNLALSMA